MASSYFSSRTLPTPAPCYDQAIPAYPATHLDSGHRPYQLQSMFRSDHQSLTAQRNVGLPPQALDSGDSTVPQKIRQKGKKREQQASKTRCRIEKRAAHIVKERHARADLRDCLCRFEDLIFFYSGWQQFSQKANLNTAGIEAQKIDLIRAMERFSHSFLHEKRCDAIRAGRVEQFELQMRTMVESAATGVSAYEGTFLCGPAALCSNLPGSRYCAEHGAADWVSCRKERSALRFEENHLAFVSSLRGPPE